MMASTIDPANDSDENFRLHDYPDVNSECRPVDSGSDNENGPSAQTVSTEATRKKRLLKKAPNAPRRFKSAYICFVMEKMDDVRKSFPDDTKVTDVMKTLASMWKSASPMERQRFERQAEDDKTRYFSEMATYSGPLQVPNKRQRRPPVSDSEHLNAMHKD